MREAQPLDDLAIPGCVCILSLLLGLLLASFLGSFNRKSRFLKYLRVGGTTEKVEIPYKPSIQITSWPVASHNAGAILEKPTDLKTVVIKRFQLQNLFY